MARRRGSGIDLRPDTLWTGRDDNPGLRRAFTWLEHTGIGVRSGSCPIGWLQMHNVAAIEAIEKAAKAQEVELAHVAVRNGVVYAGATRLGSVREFYDAADRAARR